MPRILFLPLCVALAMAIAPGFRGVADESTPMNTFTREQGSAFARLALKGAQQEYPNKPGDVLSGPKDIKGPKETHPAFYGCYDWHSSVHGHWMLVRILRVYPDLPEAKQIRMVLEQNLTAANLKVEAEHFLHPEARSFERPYGWSWLLKLAQELDEWTDPLGRTLAQNVKPLAETIAERYIAYFPRQTYPIRSGVHSNTAFGLTFAYDYACSAGKNKLKAVIEERARTYYGQDHDAPARWEPDGADFLSPSLAEADLLRRILPPEQFRVWFHKFLPGAARSEPSTLFTPATVADRSDPQIVHLDGLNLSRAWCMRGIASSLTAEDPARQALLEAAEKHAASALAHVASGNYVGEHWLASFAVQLLSPPKIP